MSPRPTALVALVAALVAPIALIGGWTLAASRRDGFDSTRATISALASHGAPDRWIMTAGLAVLGVAYVVIALVLIGSRRWGRILLAAGGVAIGLVAIFAQPSDLHFPPAVACFVLLTVWPAASGLPTPLVGWIVTGVLVIPLIWLGIELGRPHVGLAERVLAGAQSLWPLVAVVWSRRVRRSGSTADPYARPSGARS